MSQWEQEQPLRLLWLIVQTKLTANTSTLALEMVLLNIGTLCHRHLITGIQFSYIKGGMYIYETLMNRVSPYVYFRVRVKKCNLK